jgi:hypothetical protein
VLLALAQEQGELLRRAGADPTGVRTALES